MITDDDLLLYHYNDGLEPSSRERIRVALANDAELAARLNALVAQLDAVAAASNVPVPTHIEQRWQAALDLAFRNETRIANTARNALWNKVRWSAVAAACIVVGVTAGVKIGTRSAIEDFTRSQSLPPQTVASNNSARTDNSLQWQVIAAKQQLTEIADADSTKRNALIYSVIAQNRLYAIAAERAGDERLARALLSFTPILERLADNEHGDDELAQLYFELRVMQTRLAAESANLRLEDL